MRRNSLLSLALLLFLPLSVRAQDVLTLGNEIASAGGVASVPVHLLDRGSTPLGMDNGASARIQGFAFKVLFPTELVTSVAFSRAGVAATVTPLHQTALQGSGWSSCIVSFDQSTSPVPFNLNTNAPGDRIGTLVVTMRGDAPAGSVAELTLHPASAMLSNQAGTTQETIASGQLTLVNGSVTVSSVQAPANLVATATSPAQVNVTWNAVAGADHYEVWRSSGGGPFGSIGTPASAPFVDNSVSANTTYLYQVRAIDGSTPSGFSNVDAATTIVFTDEPLVVQSTKVKALHLTQLRTAVDAMRTAAELAPLPADPSIATGAVVQAEHITDLRAGLAAARAALGLSALSFTDTPPLLIKAVHIQELRNGVK